MVPLSRVPLKAARLVVRARSYPLSSLCLISLFFQVLNFYIAPQYPSRSFLARYQQGRAYDAHQIPSVHDPAREKNCIKRASDVNKFIVHIANSNEHMRVQGQTLSHEKPYFWRDLANIDELKAYFRKTILSAAIYKLITSTQLVLYVK